MEELCRTAETLSIDPEESKISGSESETVNPGSLTLPKLVPSAIQISLSESTEPLSQHELLRLLPLPAQSSPLMSAQLTSLCRLTHGKAKIVYRYIREPNFTFMDLLASFPACRVPLAQLLDLLPRLQPRAYTIIDPPETASCSTAQSLSIVFTRVDIPLASGCDAIGLRRYSHRMHGVCTGWLERLWNLRSPSSETIPLLGIYGRRNLNGFHLPNDVTKPVIMLGAGTGIAPFLCFIEEERRRRSDGRLPRRDFWLIYGCRSPTTSLLFPEELAKALTDDVLSRICFCFSRYKMPTGGPKLISPSDSFMTLAARACFHSKARYVQHCVLPLDRSTKCPETHEQELMQWVLNRNATILVCGEARALAPAVREAWENLLELGLTGVKGAVLSESAVSIGQAYVKRMRSERRYLEDIWT
ncbi:Methionine synthase reductase [Fasciola gigantica]|uniref:Methionine synthase reductase n=1 Tax=Fasciola gigantica TaxID=46835 RepID=A0A504X2Z7_FASGI|nr:Methionine synthase reductase [Fasciola gigantica]